MKTSSIKYLLLAASASLVVSVSARPIVGTSKIRPANNDQRLMMYANTCEPASTSADWTSIT